MNDANITLHDHNDQPHASLNRALNRAKEALSALKASSLDSKLDDLNEALGLFNQLNGNDKHQVNAFIRGQLALVKEGLATSYAGGVL